MPLRRRQAVAWLATIMAACSLVLVPAARTQDTSPGAGFCQVWTAEVIAPIIGAESTAEVHPSSLSDSCQWWVNPVVPRSHDPNAPWTSAFIGWEDQSLDRIMGDYPDGHSAQIGSVVGWYHDGSILLPVNDGQLYIGVLPAPGVDVEAAVMTLAELAMSQLDILPAPPTAIPAAQFTEGFCGLWSPDELAGSWAPRSRCSLTLPAACGPRPMPRTPACSWWPNGPMATLTASGRTTGRVMRSRSGQ